jgi:membrane protease YdiL (CAAX protease family)
LERYPFSRIFNRTFMISGIILFFVCRRFLKIGTLSELGIIKLQDGSRDLLIGWALAVGSMAALLGVMTISDVFEPYLRLSLSRSLQRGAGALAAGIFAGFLEEVFFRGIIFKGLLEDGGRARAFILANLFYSALHFVKPGESYYLEQFDSWAGFRHLFATFQPFFEPLPLLPGFLGLFLIGVILSQAFARTGNLYLSIGLHAGWIFSLKTVRVFGDYTREDLGWWFGSAEPKIVSGAITWVGLLLVGLAVHWITRKRAGLSAASTCSDGNAMVRMDHGKNL